MRVHRLEIEGFGPFRDRQVVDFDAVAQDGVFLIGGKTGAGKSSILDAICFALYGDVPRYDDGDRRLRSDYAAPDEPTRVRMEFTSAGRRWLLERVPSYERLKKNGKGTTVSAAQARLSEWRDGEWVDIAARTVDVAHELSDIVGLTKAQFLQVILLAQGRFQEFLHAKNDDRQKLLRTLFGSHRFQEFEARLDERRRQVTDRLALENRTFAVQLESAERLAATVETADGAGADDDAPLTDPAARLAAVHTASLRAAHAAELAAAEEGTLRSAHEEAEAAHAARVRQREQQQRRDRARESHAALEARAPQIADDRVALARAREAEELRGVIDAAQRADAAAGDAAAAADAARAAWEAARPSPRGTTDAAPVDTPAVDTAPVDTALTDAAAVTAPVDAALTDAAAIEAQVDALVRQLAEIEPALDLEARLPALKDAAARATDAVDALQRSIAQCKERRATLPQRIDALDGQLTVATARAAGLTAAAERAHDRRARLDAAREAVALTAAVARAETEAVAAGRALTRASGLLDELRERRFRDHAGELAELLVDGEPCAVCGATAHPAPAAHRDDPVSQADLDAAQQRKDAAIAADAAATATLREAEQKLAAASARAGGVDEPTAQAELDAAEADETEARNAAEERARLEGERIALLAERDDIEQQLAALEEQRTSDERAALVHVEEERRAREQVAAARGDHESVQSRAVVLAGILDLGRGLLDALRALAERRDAAARAAEDAGARLAESSFADADAAVAALRDPAERMLLDTRIREHDAELAAVRGTLMELELELLPEEPIEVDAAERERASQAWRAAVERAALLSERAGQLAAAVEAADVAHEAIADVAAEADVIEQLAHTVAGRGANTKKMDLETFVLAAELEKIVAAANVRLGEMSDGRYLLEHSDALAAHGRASGLGITVMDRYTGQSRPVQSLSGGETFLASLALALGLAQVVTAEAGGTRLDTLFIDEGFGSLDADTLEVAMRTLDELRSGGRTVGVISHVEAMQADLPAGIVVQATAEGPSVIRQDAFAAL